MTSPPERRRQLRRVSAQAAALLLLSSSPAFATRWVQAFGDGYLWIDTDDISQQDGLTRFVLGLGKDKDVPPPAAAKEDIADPGDAIDCATGDYYHHDAINWDEFVKQPKSVVLRFEWVKHPQDYPGLQPMLRKEVCAGK